MSGRNGSIGLRSVPRCGRAADMPATFMCVRCEGRFRKPESWRFLALPSVCARCWRVQMTWLTPAERVEAYPDSVPA